MWLWTSYTIVSRSMGYLFLDTRATAEARAWWLDKRGEEMWQEGGRAQELLSVIARERARLTNELEGVAVVAGPGRFSALRVGILYAHLLARWWKKPLYALTPADVASTAARVGVVEAIQSGVLAAAGYVAPEYDREPNITTPRV